MIGHTAGANIVTGFAGVVLVWIVQEDLRFFRIRNLAVLVFAMCFALACFVAHRVPLLLPHGIFAGAVFALTAAAFAAGLMGGGDAKLLSAVLFWVGPEDAVAYAMLLFLATALYVAGAKLGLCPSRRIGSRTAIPFGPSIAGAWLALVALSLRQ